MPPFNLPRLPAPTASRLTLYTLSSVSLAALVLLNACSTRTNLFSAAVSISKSNGALMVLGNLALCLSLLVGMALQRVFFGRLRAIEVEHLYDKAWYFLTESLLAFTMFREDFNIGFLSLFGLLFGLKCFHWIAADRVDYLDQLPSPPRWTFHLRLLSLLNCLLLPLDALCLFVTARALYTMGMGGRVLFVSEFAILIINFGGISGRYAVWGWDLWRVKRARAARLAEREARRVAAGAAAPTGDRPEEEEEDEDDDEEEVWEGKSMVLFYLDLTKDFLKLIVYLGFFGLVLTAYGLPFNILRDLFVTMRSFITRLRSLFQYRAATRDMESRYADASEAEIEEQGVCIICRDSMTFQAPGGKRVKRLVCGHAFHLRCLRMWLERQQSCPTCRRTVLGNAAPPTAQPAAPPLPGAIPTATAGAAQPQPPHGQDQRPLPPNLENLRDHLARDPPAPLGVAHTGPVPPATGGLFGAPNPPARFAHLFPPPPPVRQPTALNTQQAAGSDDSRYNIDVNLPGFRFRLRFGGNVPQAQIANVAPAVNPPVMLPPTAAHLPVPTPTVRPPTAPILTPTVAAPAGPSMTSSASMGSSPEGSIEPAPEAPETSPSDTASAVASSSTLDDQDVQDGTTLTPREVAVRAALRRSARLNPSSASPPHSSSSATLALAPSSSGQTLSPTNVVNELEDGSVFFSIPPPPTAAGPSSSTSVPPALREEDSSFPAAGPSTMPSSRPRVTLRPLQPIPSPTPLQALLNNIPKSSAVPSLPLSPTLSQHQLAILSQQTRQLVEERLRLIDRIDSVLSSLRGEIARAQHSISSKASAPTPSYPNPAVDVSGGVLGQASGSSGAVDPRRKGKAREEVEPRDVPLPAEEEESFETDS